VSHIFEVVINVFYQYTQKISRIDRAFRITSRTNDRIIKKFYFAIIS